MFIYAQKKEKELLILGTKKCCPPLKYLCLNKFSLRFRNC